MRPKFIALELIEDRIDPSHLANMPDTGLDYASLGFPEQGVARRLYRAGILRPMKKSIVPNSEGRNVLRTIWGPGVYFKAFRDYYLKNKEELCNRLACVAECSHPVAV